MIVTLKSWLKYLYLISLLSIVIEIEKKDDIGQKFNLWIVKILDFTNEYPALTMTQYLRNSTTLYNRKLLLCDFFR